MALRDDLMKAGRKAAEVLSVTDAKYRVEIDGYTRIDPFLIAAGEGIPVLLRKLDRLLGAFIREGQPGILINGYRPAGLIHMTCAHELGHYFLGHESKFDESLDHGSSGNVQERQADWFAYLLLMPRWLIARLMQKKSLSTSALLVPETVYQLSLRMGLSYSGTVWSFQRLNLISLAQANVLLRVEPLTIKSRLLSVPLEDPANQDVWLLDATDRDAILEPRENDRVIVELPSRVASGYVWSVEDFANEGFTLKPILVDGRQERPEIEGRSLPVGGKTAVRYQLNRAADTAAGSALRLRESQPWTEPQPTDARFALDAKLEAIPDGLTGGSKVNLVEEVAAS